MKRLVCPAALGTALLVAACADSKKGVDLTEVDTALSSDAIQTSFAISCGVATAMSARFDAFVAANPDKVSAEAQYYANLAKMALFGHNGTEAICTTPYPTSIASLMPKVTEALMNLYFAYVAQGLDPKVRIAAPMPAATASTQ